MWRVRPGGGTVEVKGQGWAGGERLVDGDDFARRLETVVIRAPDVGARSCPETIRQPYVKQQVDLKMLLFAWCHLN